MHIYVVTNLKNDKIYIGQHSGDDLQAYLRLQCLRAFSERRSKDKPLLYRAIRKHGAEAFVVASLVCPCDKQQMNELEKFFIRTLDARDPEIGYNLTEGGTGGATRCGYKNSEHQKEAVSSALTGRSKSPEHRKHLSESKLGKPAPAVAESNIRRRHENPSLAALRSRKYRADKKKREVSCQS
jgi:group I intron endonuclease